MITCFLWIIFSAILTFMGIFLLENPGDIHLTWLNYEIHVSLLAFVGLVALMIFILLHTKNILYFIYHVPQKITHKKQISHLKRQRIKENNLMVLGQTHQPEKCLKLLNSKPPLSCPDMEKWFQAQSLLLKDETKKAQNILESLVKNPLYQLSALKGLIDICVKEKNLQEAEKWCQQALKQKPSWIWGKRQYLKIFIQKKQWDKALNLIKKDKRNNAFSPEEKHHYQATIYHTQGQEAWQSYQPEKAQKYYLQALKAQPKFIPAHFALAQNKNTDKKSILYHLKKIWDQSPHGIVGEMAFNLIKGDTPNLIKKVKNFNEKQEKHFYGQWLKAKAYVHLNVIMEAEKIYDHLKKTNNNIDLHLLKADIEHKKGNQESSHDSLIKAAKSTRYSLWICEQCHNPHEIWDHACHHCQKVACIKMNS